MTMADVDANHDCTFPSSRNAIRAATDAEERPNRNGFDASTYKCPGKTTRDAVTRVVFVDASVILLPSSMKRS